MNNICQKLLLLLPVLLCADPASAGVDCDGVPHTRLELAICNDPLLRALDAELTEAFKSALALGVINEKVVTDQRNQIAQYCRREPNAAFNACLLGAGVASLEWTVEKLNPSEESMTSAAENTQQRYDRSLTTRTNLLKRQLKVAEYRLRFTADPELTVTTVISLINAYGHPEQRDSNTALVSKLEHRLASGCDHPVYGRKWQSTLTDNNISCDDLRPSQLLSSSDL